MRTKMTAMIFLTFALIMLPYAPTHAALILPFKFYETMPDNSQYAGDYNSDPAHGDQWGNMMCGPTSAKNSMLWLANTNPELTKLKQKKVGDAWVDMSHAEMIEELAKKMAPGWDWDNDAFPGVLDDQFVNGKKEYAESRGIKLDIKWMKNTTLGQNWGKETVGEPTLEWIKNEIDDDEDVEISTPQHWVTVDVSTAILLKEWVTVGGYLGEGFDDVNGNGIWDIGEQLWDANDLYQGNDTFWDVFYPIDIPPPPDDIGTENEQDYYLWINDPADGHDGWQLVIEKDGKLSVGSLGYIETAVSESPVPVPATILLLGSGLIGILGFRIKKKTSQ